MIHGIGIDAVDIQRFASWRTKSDKALEKILTSEEITYCRSEPLLSAERFAGRFAAREALYKALSSSGFLSETCSLVKLCRLVKIHSSSTGAPLISIDWSTLLDKHQQQPTIFVSLTHTATTALAVVILELPT